MFRWSQQQILEDMDIHTKKLPNARIPILVMLVMSLETHLSLTGFQEVSGRTMMVVPGTGLFLGAFAMKNYAVIYQLKAKTVFPVATSLSVQNAIKTAKTLFVRDFIVIPQLTTAMRRDSCLYPI